jgi:hypothetical protein
VAIYSRVGPTGVINNRSSMIVGGNLGQEAASARKDLDLYCVILLIGLSMGSRLQGLGQRPRGHYFVRGFRASLG